MLLTIYIYNYIYTIYEIVFTSVKYTYTYTILLNNTLYTLSLFILMYYSTYIM